MDDKNKTSDSKLKDWLLSLARDVISAAIAAVIAEILRRI